MPLQTLKTNKQQWLFNTDKNCHYDKEYNEEPCPGKKCPLCKLNGKLVFERSQEEGEQFILKERERIESVRQTREFLDKKAQLKNLRKVCVNLCIDGRVEYVNKC